jgi:tripartite-type tricarboxylate transporter receptor subunit TctC
MLTVAAAGWLADPVSTARAQTVEEFYKGRTITLLVSSAPGGISDIASRLVARHLHRFIPGQPSIVVQNLPGQSGVILVNRMYNALPKTGEVIAFIERGPPQLAILGNPNVKFDPLRFTWLGSLSSYRDDAYLLTIMARSPVTSVNDLKTQGLSIHLSAMTPGTTNFTFAYIAKNVLGLNISIVRGYPGAAPMFLAMQAGEADGMVVGLGAIKAGQPALWSNRELRPLIQFARATRHPELPDIPIGRELAADDDARALIEFAELPFFMALPFAAPPDVPADRAKALRDGFMQMAADADFIAEATRLSIELSPVDGEAIRKLLERAASSPKTVIDDYNRLLIK